VVFAALLVRSVVPSQGLAAAVSAAVVASPTAATPSLRVVEIPVEGMACVSCAASIKNAVRNLTGVVGVEVSLEKRNARVTYLATLLTPDQIIAAIDKLGYTAGMPKDAP
jgi:copper chaperone CopZ